MNGTQSNAGVAAYSDHETDASENESEMGDFKSAQEHPVEETNWSACSDNENNLNLTNESDVSAGALDPLASPGRRKSTSSIADQKSPDSSGSRSDSGSITPDNASPNRNVHQDIGLSNSPTHAKSGSASPNHLADGSANHNSASESPAHKSGSPSPRNSTSPVRSRPSSPEAVRRKDSSPTVAPGSPVNVKSQSASPVNLNSDTEDEKNVGAIDLESDDDCMIVEEDKAKKKDKTPKKEVAQSPKQKASNGKPEPAKEKTVKEEPEPSLRRSLRVTKRKSYIDDSNVDDVSDSEKDTKKPKIAPPVPLITTTISSQFRLINPQTTIKSTFPGSVQSPKIVNPQNGIVAQSMLNSMAQRGVSIVATPVNRPQPTPPQPPAAPKPVKKPAPPPPFPKDSVFAGMTNGQSLIEAPSFLSPLLFVKKPLVSLRKFVDEFGEEVKREQKKREDELEAQRMKEEEERKAREEEERKAMEEEAARKKEEAERLGSSGEPKKKGRRKQPKYEDDDSWHKDQEDSSSESETSSWTSG